MGKNARAIIISGFLGSGKTTLLKEIISWKDVLSDVAIIVNEFGEVGIDGSLLEQTGSNIVELNTGCICCSMQGDLRRALLDIKKGFSPTWFLIEATGLADPRGIVEVFTSVDLKDIEVHKVITVLDAEYWENRDIFGPLFENQLKAADLLLVNKIDLLQEDKISQILKDISSEYPETQVIPTVYAKVDPDTVFMPIKRGSGFISPIKLPMVSGHVAHEDESHLHNTYSYKGYTSYAYSIPKSFRFECFKKFIESLPLNVFRIKGWIQTDKGPYLLNLAGGKGTFEPSEKLIKNSLVFIGWDMDEKFIKKELDACIS